MSKYYEIVVKFWPDNFGHLKLVVFYPLHSSQINSSLAVSFSLVLVFLKCFSNGCFLHK